MEGGGSGEAAPELTGLGADPRIAPGGDRPGRDSPRATTAALVDGLAGVLADNLLGVYLHGSLALGCFNPRRSDIDLLAVTRQPMSPAQRRAVAAFLLASSGRPYPIEISILAREHLHPWRYPTPFDFHYSEDWRDQTAAALADGSWQRWTASERGDPDLAAHITVLRARGVRLLGPPIAEVFPAVPRADFVDALRLDVLDPRFGLAGLAEHPVYSLLNACRTLAYLRAGAILSKAEGGAWALAALPAEHRPAIEAALAAYAQGDTEEERALLTSELAAAAAYLHEELAQKIGAAGAP
ncbi:MAG: Streptomycin 3''-adenylyltransferase [Chloroflexi bacterium ADurb.Bin325]|nr:MAG: Streptomycin 3''-adenylyltransferase [Chloroflexi bacterium ADurb.Bin325]